MDQRVFVRRAATGEEFAEEDEVATVVEPGGHADSEQYRCLLELMLAAGVSIGEALGPALYDLDRRPSLIRVECQLGRSGSTNSACLCVACSGSTFVD